MSLFDFEPTLDQISQTISETADENLPKQIQLYVFMRNFFAATEIADKLAGSDDRVSRYVFEKVGIGARLYELGNALCSVKKWTRETFSWEKLKTDQNALTVLEHAAGMAAVIDVEYWKECKKVETRSSAHIGPKYELDDFFRDFPDLDYSIERRLSSIQDTNLREILKQQELRERKRETEEARRRERMEELWMEREDRRERQLHEHFQRLSTSIRGVGPDQESTVSMSGGGGVTRMDPQVPAAGETVGRPTNWAHPAGIPPVSLGSGNAGQRGCISPDGNPQVGGRGGEQGQGIEVPPERSVIFRGGGVGAHGDANFLGRAGVDERLDQLMGGRVQQPNFEQERTPHRPQNLREVPQPAGVLHENFNNTQPAVQETRADPGAIPVYRNLVGSKVKEPVFVDKASEWIGYKMAMEVYLASQGAFSVQAQTMHLMGSLSGFARSELVRCYSDRRGGWFDLNELWTQLDQYFCRDKTQEFEEEPYEWIKKYPWDGNEWSLNNFCSQISQRFAKLLGHAHPGLSGVIAKTILKAGFPPELLHELNRKRRNDLEWRDLDSDVDLLNRAVHAIFKDFKESGMDVPWTQSRDPKFSASGRQSSLDKSRMERKNSQPRLVTRIWKDGRYRPVEVGTFLRSSPKPTVENSATRLPESELSRADHYSGSKRESRLRDGQEARRRTSAGSPSSVYRQNLARSTSPANSPSRSHLICYFCQKPGHIKSDCFLWQAELKRQKERRGSGGHTSEKMLKAAEVEPHVDGGKKFYERELIEELNENPFPNESGASSENSFVNSDIEEEDFPELSDKYASEDEQGSLSSPEHRLRHSRSSSGFIGHEQQEALNW